MPIFIKHLIYTIYFCIQFFPLCISAATYLSPDRIVKNTTFTQAKSPYIIEHSVTVKSGVTITVEKGAVLVFTQGGLFLDHARLVGSGFEIQTAQEAENTSAVFSGVGASIDISNVQAGNMYRSGISVWGDSSVAISGGYFSSLGSLEKTAIQIFDSSRLFVTDSDFHKFSKALDVFNTSYATITDSGFTYNTRGVYTFDAQIYVSKSDFIQNAIAIEHIVTDTSMVTVDAQDNWWGRKERPLVYMYKTDMAQTDINTILGNVIYTPWSYSSYRKKVQGLVSNVLFLPGLMGSRLYQKGVFENQLWEPNRNKDVKKLFLNPSGESIEKDIYTRDVLAQTNIAGGVDMIEQTPYKDFFAYMNQLVKTGVIQSWKAAPYDWRFFPDTIIQEGVSVGTTQGQIFTQSIVAELLLLAKTSKTKKVTIITHSNGGLVAKQLMIELEKQKLDSLVDKIIYVAMPEYGTAQAITSLLYGHEQSIAGGLILRADVAKQLGIHMPTSYTLLPSQKYFDVYPSISVGSDSVHSKQELNVSLNKKGNINNNLSHKADVFHQKVDTWKPADTVPTYQIVGTGLLTTSGFIENADKVYVPTYTTSGDGVVQDMYDKKMSAYVRTGDIFTVDLKGSKHTHMNMMNHTQVMSYLDALLRKTSVVGEVSSSTMHTSHIFHSNTYTLFQISSSFSTTSMMSKKYIETYTDLDMDLLSYLPNQQYHIVQSKHVDTSSRFDVFDATIQYLTQEPIQNIRIQEQYKDMIDVRVFDVVEDVTGLSSTQNIRETVYKDVPVFGGGGLIIEQASSQVVQSLDSSISSTTPYIEMVLPILQETVQIEPVKQIIYGQSGIPISTIYIATSTEDFLTKISRIQRVLQTSRITPYVKQRYIARLQIVAKTYNTKGDAQARKDLQSLIQKIDQSILSIQSFSNTPALKSRYAKLKEDYIYIRYLLR